MKLYHSAAKNATPINIKNKSGNKNTDDLYDFYVKYHCFGYISAHIDIYGAHYKRRKNPAG